MPDMLKSDLPPTKSFAEFAQDLLDRFPGVDHSALLKDVTAQYFMDLKFGNKREEREACNFLNLLQQRAIQHKPKATP